MNKSKSPALLKAEVHSMFESMFSKKLSFNKLSYTVYAAAMTVCHKDSMSVLNITWGELFTKLKIFANYERKLGNWFTKLCQFYYEWKEAIYGFYDFDINSIPVFSDLINPNHPTVVPYPVANAKRWLKRIANENGLVNFTTEEFGKYNQNNKIY